MKLSNLEAALTKRPFLPFEIRIDGEVIEVRHPEQVFLAARKTTVIVDATDRLRIVDVEQITKLALVKRRKSNGR